MFVCEVLSVNILRNFILKFMLGLKISNNCIIVSCLDLFGRILVNLARLMKEIIFVTIILSKFYLTELILNPYRIILSK